MSMVKRGQMEKPGAARTGPEAVCSSSHARETPAKDRCDQEKGNQTLQTKLSGHLTHIVQILSSIGHA